MMVTFAVKVPAGEDVDAAARELLNTAEFWVLTAVLSGSFDPMPPVTVERTLIPVWIPTDETVSVGFGVAPALKLSVETLLEAKVEVEQ